MSLAAVGDHLWQSTVFAFAVWLAALALRGHRARVRHNLWLAASLKFLIPFSLLISLGAYTPHRAIRARSASNVSVAADQLSRPFSPPISAPLLAAVPPAPNRTPAILSAIWAAGFIGISAAWWIRWRRVRAIVRGGKPGRLDLPIPAVVSEAVIEPGIFGIFRPALMLPRGIFERLTPEQLHAVIAHELAHARHRDNLSAAAHMLVESVFWFHPLVWWMGKRLIEERERGCDEEVLAQADPRAYAEGILNVCKLYAESPLACVAGVGGANLKQRIEAIMHHRIAPHLTRARKAALAAAALAALAAPVAIGFLNAPFLRAQAAAPQAFDAVSIKLLPDRPTFVSTNAPLFRISGTRVTLNFRTVSDILAAAYDVKTYQVIGAPDWAGSAGLRYNIEAKAPGDAPPADDQVRLMLQSMLADRLQLKLHRDSKEMSVYHLGIAKGGMKMKLIPAGDKSIATPPARRFPFDMILRLLSTGLDRPIIDQTGITGTVEYTMDWARMDTARREDPDGFALGTLATAAEENLGLKLTGAKDRIATLVIDHIEKPSEN